MSNKKVLIKRKYINNRIYSIYHTNFDKYCVTINNKQKTTQTFRTKNEAEIFCNKEIINYLKSIELNNIYNPSNNIENADNTDDYLYNYIENYTTDIVLSEYKWFIDGYLNTFENIKRYDVEIGTKEYSKIKRFIDKLFFNKKSIDVSTHGNIRLNERGIPKPTIDILKKSRIISYDYSEYQKKIDAVKFTYITSKAKYYYVISSDMCLITSYKKDFVSIKKKEKKSTGYKSIYTENMDIKIKEIIN